MKQRTSVLDKQYDFWKSEQHERWMLSLNRGDEHDYTPVAVEINGVIIPYTSCREIGHSEPFDNALAKFPDYRKVGSGTLRGFRWRKDTEVNV